MAWNVGLLCVKAEQKEINSIIPDIFYKSKEDLCFEEVTSISMDKALGVSFSDSWIIIVDINGRFVFDNKYPIKLSKKYKVKSFFISEGLIFKDYKLGLLRRGKINKIIKGKKEGESYLKRNNIKPIDKWGETMIFQIIENEIFGLKREDYGTSLNDLKYSKYDFD